MKLSTQRNIVAAAGFALLTILTVLATVYVRAKIVAQETAEDAGATP